MRYNPVETYLQEAEELLAEVEQVALTLDMGAGSEETIHQLFRAFHTIKGSGAMCGLDGVAAFTHHVETLLDQVRSGAIPVSPGLTDVVLKSKDHIKKILIGVQCGEETTDGAEEILSAISALENGGAPAGGEARPVIEPQPETAGAGKEQAWSIEFRPNREIFARGINPAGLLRELRGLGACEITAHTDQVPPIEAVQPDLCYLWWSISLKTSCDENAIRDVFVFVEGDCTLNIRRIEADDPIENAQSSPASEPEDESAAPERQPPPGGRSGALTRESTVRVPSERLDRLVRLVGELVMNQSRLTRAVAQTDAPEFANPVQELQRLVAELRDNVLGIRMLPIGNLFERFRRLVRDLSGELGKEVDLVVEGAETELDKSILDQLGEPLVHCLRNCLDHGVETPADRERAGKSQRATVRLSAVHAGSDVVIVIEDDGRGIDKQAVRAKALEKRLIAADADLSNKDILNLILMPGFSTAREVTNVSGRGVGMDAVKRQIDALRGSVALASETGHGTRISITLPLTLAIIDGLLVQVGNDQFIVPMSTVTENVELDGRERMRKNGRNVIAVRGELVPYIDLRSTFSIDGSAPPIEKVVIAQHEGQRAGLVVDRVLGTHQTVIQSLGRFFKQIEVVSGATIMGDGRVALILDVAAVVRLADRQSQDACTAMERSAA